MAHHITKKLDFEKGTLRDKASNPDYRERFQEEGDHFDRGGTPGFPPLKFHGSTYTFSTKPFITADKESLIRALERNYRFVISGHTGTVYRLLKIPEVVDEVAERFERTRLSILRADEITGVATHPKKGRDFYVVPFKCFLQPSEPLPNPIFKQYLAVTATIPSPNSSPPR